MWGWVEGEPRATLERPREPSQEERRQELGTAKDITAALDQFLALSKAWPKRWHVCPSRRTIVRQPPSPGWSEPQPSVAKRVRVLAGLAEVVAFAKNTMGAGAPLGRRWHTPRPVVVCRLPTVREDVEGKEECAIIVKIILCMMKTNTDI